MAVLSAALSLAVGIWEGEKVRPLSAKRSDWVGAERLRF